jgi:hypothetical protein
MAYESHIIEGLDAPVTDLATIPTLSIAQMKEAFDAGPLQIIAAFNALVNDLGDDKDEYDAWKADLEALNLDVNTAAAITALLLAHASRHGSGGADRITPAAIGAAELQNAVVTPAQARCLVQTKTASFTLAAGDEEKLTLLTHATVAIVVTVPLDSTYDFPIGTAFNFVRNGAAAASFSFAGGIAYKMANDATAISAYGSSATIIKTGANTWWGICG